MKIPENEYLYLIRSNLWRSEYQKRVERANKFMAGLDELNSEQFWYIQQILKGEI